MEKIIFLDFDGVLNSQLWFTHTNGNREDEELDKNAIGYLNTLIKKTSAKVVVSSTWRLGKTVEQLQDILNRSGFEGEVIDKTENLRYTDFGDAVLRGNEIYHWLREHPEITQVGYWDYKNYVIFDDDSDMLYWQRYNFIQTDPYVGLTPTDIYNAEKILNA